VLDILGFRPSGASVAADADAVFKAIFAGWSNANEAYRTPYKRITSGVSGDGWEYAQLRSFLEQGDRKILGMVFLVRLGARTAVMAAIRPGTEMNEVVKTGTNEPLCLDEYMSPDWGQFFHGLRFAGWTPAPDALARQLIGSWYASSINVGIVYVFAANGRFDSAHGYETSKRVAPELLEKTLHGFAGSGAYKLTGNRLDMTTDAGKRENVLIRWERTSENALAPEEFIRMLTVDGRGNPIEVRYRRD
jgi:hypothetical protein